MIKRVLKNKLASLGYNAQMIENKIKELTIKTDFSKYTESELIEKLKIVAMDKPSAEIPRFFLNLNGKFVEQFVFDGELSPFNKFSMLGSQLSLVDFRLDKSVCLMGISKEKDIFLLVYFPSRETLSRYANKSYEDILSSEREELIRDYMEAFTAGNRLSNNKAKDILYVLTSEYMIDTILLENLNPRIKLYDNANKFAEQITNYYYKYINRRINRIEFVEKSVQIKFAGYGVQMGNISNEPYLLLKEVNQVANFYLNRPTYAWLVTGSRGQEEIAIYTANESYPAETYRDLVLKKEDTELRDEANKLALKFSSEVRYQISKEYIFSVLKKLNRELILPPYDFIMAHTQDSLDAIGLLCYRFSCTSQKKEFETILYNSIEDNLNNRFRYRFVEKLSGIYTTIGNKLNYTDITGKVIRKQSVADFNIHFNAAVVKRETIIDQRSIEQLMGYMYKDIHNVGIDMLPTPSIEVVFYFPEVSMISNEVEMYNGTSVEIAKGDGTTSFYEIGATNLGQNMARPTDPNEKYAVVKYVDSDGRILKENIIRDVMVGSTFVPEMLPVINDKEGKEWVCAPNQILSKNISEDNRQNEMEVKYIKKMAVVRINYINRLGKELRSQVIKNMQVGEIFEIDSVRKFTDSNKVEWTLYQSKPNRLIVSDEEKENIVTLIYDVVKADVFVSYQTRDGVMLRPKDKFSAVAYKEFTPEILPTIADEQGLVWKYAEDSQNIIFVQESEENEVTLQYDALKQKVVTLFLDEDGNKIKDDQVEFYQVGQTISTQYDNEYTDYYGAKWLLKKVDKPTIHVSENESDNICTVIYQKQLAIVILSFMNKLGQKIKEDKTEKAQIGTSYTAAQVQEIMDSNGNYWTCIEQAKFLKVTDSEVNNKISFQYAPLMSKVTVQYVDIEGNELLPAKQAEVQVGSKFVPDIIDSIQGKDQRGWVVSPTQLREFVVKKHQEENTFKINYDKKLVNIVLSFKDIHGNKLKEDLTQQAQIGSEYMATAYGKITSENGERWMLTRTEPAKLFVRENSHFILLYDEIMAKVIVKCVNVTDNKPIVNDMAIMTKLGGVFVPNIQQKLVDKAKYRWTYVGEPGTSIVTKENEQENIVVLKYEPDLATVTLRYLNKNQQMVHPDVVTKEQIGKEIAIKEFEKIIEDNGLGWKLKNISRHTILVDEDSQKNEVISNYEPLMVSVTTRYIDERLNELVPNKVEEKQVGEIFHAVPLPRITDANNYVWIYSNIPTVEITVKDDTTNKVNVKYLPYKKKVTQKFISLANEKLQEDSVEEYQVGTTFVLQKKERVEDSEQKSWIYKKSSAEKLTVQEEEAKNSIVNYYEKELTKVTVQYQTVDGQTLAKDKVMDLQIGSQFVIEAKEEMEDNAKHLWKVLPEKTKENENDFYEFNQFHVKIARDTSQNTFLIRYDKYLVNVYDKYLNEKTGEEVIKDTITQQQVGTQYLVRVKECIIDKEGRHWVQAAKSDTKIFTSSYKVEPITVGKDESKNVTVVKYKPKLALVTIYYQDSLGREIRKEEVTKLQVGSFFEENIPKKIEDSVKNKWVFNPNSETKIRIDEDPQKNKVILAYEEEKGIVTFVYLDKAGNQLKQSTTKLIQIGNVYTPQFDMILTDEKGCVWEYAERNLEKLEVKEQEEENKILLTYIPLNVDVHLLYVDLWGNEITTKVVKAQLGSKYIPTICKSYTNENGLLYHLNKMDPESITVKETPIAAKENKNQMKLIFEPVNSVITIEFEDLEGNSLKEAEKVTKQVGTHYKPNISEFIKDRKGNEWHLVSKEQEEIVVKENEKENQLKFVYEVAKADIVIRYINLDGFSVKPEQTISKQVGTDFVPAPEPFVLDSENKKWRLLKVQPVQLKVGSINNIVTVTYQEEKAKVVWKYMDMTGKLLRGDETHEVQIGLRYTPLVSNKTIYDANEIWRLMKIEPYEMIVSENVAENVVNLIYSNEKVATPKEEKKEIYNPFANTLIDTPTDTTKDTLVATSADTTTTSSNISNIITQNENIFEQKADPISTVIENAATNQISKEVTTENVTTKQMSKGVTTEKSLNEPIRGEALKQPASGKEEDGNVEANFEFSDPYLRKLSKEMLLSLAEKKVLEELKQIDIEIMTELAAAKCAYEKSDGLYDWAKVQELINKEKEVIKQNIDKFIAKDKNSTRMLKIFEHIMASDKDEETFGKLQQRKAVLITDYFLDKPLDNEDKVIYISEKGKNEKEIAQIEYKLNNKSWRYNQEVGNLKAKRYYEKLLLENYYKARNTATDHYFDDKTIKLSMAPEVIIGVTNLLVMQAVNLLKKENISLEMQNELEAIIHLCTPEQQSTIRAEIEKIDGKQKRVANKLMQEILKGK